MARKTSRQSKDTASKIRAVAGAASSVKVKKRHRKYVLLVILVLIAAIVVSCWFYDRSSLKISDFLYDTFYELIHPTPEMEGMEYQTVTTGNGVANGEMLIHFIDVGQGDSILIQFPDGKNMVIDGGPRSAKNALLAYLDAQNVTEIEYLMLTHSDEDHCGSLDDVLTHTEVHNIYWPGVSNDTITTAVYRQFTDAKDAEEGAECIVSESGMRFGSEEFGYWFYIITPDEGDADEVKSGDAHSINAISPIMFLEFGDRKVCFTGDSNEENEEVFVQKTRVLDWTGDGIADEEDLSFYDCDILKVAHHGSESSSTQAFLDIVKPEYAVISAGEGNKSGHPTAEALSRLETTPDSLGRDGATIYCTIECGNIVFRLSAEEGDTEIAAITGSKGLHDLNSNRSGDAAGLSLQRPALFIEPFPDLLERRRDAA